MSEETHCPFCDAEYKEEFYSGSYETYLAPCPCDTAKRYRDLKIELSSFDSFVELKRNLRSLPSVIEDLSLTVDYKKKELSKCEKSVAEASKTLGIKKP